MSAVEIEIASQPELWARAAALAPEVADQLPEPGVRLAVIGCGTSLFMAQAFAALRERAGQGETDAFPASELPAHRPYHTVLAISRSGTTTEVVRALEQLDPPTGRVTISTVAGLPAVEAAQRAVLLPFADEDSIVQTRFATTALALLRAHLGEDLEPLIAEGTQALARELPADPEQFEHFVFLGTGPSVGLASEAALKFREAAQAWSEAYPAKEFRHGPISVAGPRTLVWLLGGRSARPGGRHRRHRSHRD